MPDPVLISLNIDALAELPRSSRRAESTPVINDRKQITRLFNHTDYGYNSTIRGALALIFGFKTDLIANTT